MNENVSSLNGTPVRIADEDLLRSFLEGDEDAFRELMDRYRDRVFRVAMRYLNGKNDVAEDVTQQVFVKIFTSGNTFRGSGSFKSWLFTITSNLAISEARRGKSYQKAVAANAVSDVDSSNEDSETPTPARSKKLREAISLLPQKQRTIVSLRIDAGLPFDEIAKIAGTSVNSAKVNYHHAAVSLKRLLLREVIE